ncbi:MAG: efflux RND transporter periplasmic adaptor subunit [Rhodoferax sp.]|uniref:efflux RND transporter periplasmic adaptor subunit n=1 Tax=Rhodoferax sp. TaxID=50421 RepID=UPI002607974B|nr:efflux RND transporter periplasmic adaptor subunit [Rhodoferax sp.]MDD2881004.1 efflux RND transporter periplasmic adaptor subunit [Rhodoferax sp.]
MASKFTFAAVAVLGIAISGGAAWWLQSRPQGPTQITANGDSSSANGGAGKAVGAAPRVAGVEVTKVETSTLRDDAQAVGSLRARQSVMLRPELVGRITALNFKDGGPVRKGQILVQFDDLLQQAELQQMQAQLAIAQASFKRTQELVAQNFMAQQTLDTSAANLKVAQAQLALSQARLSRMAVRAPFDGTVGIRLVNVGDYVKDGADLVALEDTRQMLVDYRLPERFGGKVKPGQSVEIALDALPGRSFNAVVEAVEPLMDANGRSVAVRAVISGAGKPADKPGNQVVDKSSKSGNKADDKKAGQVLRSGMFARVATLFSVNDAALVVPEEAIVPQGGKQFVIKVVAPVAGATLPADVKFVSLRQEVKLGVRRSGKVEIVDGVALGDTVVVAGQQRLQKDGSPLRIVELGKPAGKTAAPVAPALAASR